MKMMIFSVMAMMSSMAFAAEPASSTSGDAILQATYGVSSIDSTVQIRKTDGTVVTLNTEAGIKTMVVARGPGTYTVMTFLTNDQGHFRNCSQIEGELAADFHFTNTLGNQSISSTLQRSTADAPVKVGIGCDSQNDQAFDLTFSAQ